MTFVAWPAAGTLSSRVFASLVFGELDVSDFTSYFVFLSAKTVSISKSPAPFLFREVLLIFCALLLFHPSVAPSQK